MLIIISLIELWWYQQVPQNKMWWYLIKLYRQRPKHKKKKTLSIMHLALPCVATVVSCQVLVPTVQPLLLVAKAMYI